MEQEGWDPEPEVQEPTTMSDEPIIDLKGDNDANDLGLLEPNAPDEMLNDEESAPARLCSSGVI